MATNKPASAQLSIVQVSTSELKPAVYNPRKWDKGAIDRLTESIKRFGLIDPLLVNGAKERKNILIGGHFRLKIAKDLGYTEVPVVYLDIPDEQKEKELNLRLNQNTGDWDYDLLKDFDINLLLDVGFDDLELSSIWDENLSTEDDNFNTEKELEEARKNPQTETGDIFQLGHHRIVCGDSTDPEVVKALLGEIKLDAIMSDPPFNLNYSYQKGLGKKKKYACEEVEDNRTEEEYRVFLEQTLQNGLDHCKKDAHIFYFCDQKYIGLLQDLYKRNGIKNQRVALWIKNNANPTPQVAFNKQYEPCVYGTIGKPYLSERVSNFTEILNPEIETGNRTIDDILDLLDIWLVRRLPTSEYRHPTEKPVTLHEKPLRRCTKPGDTVLDLFGGSGSTLIACEQMGRRAFLVEKDPAFCDVIINRFKSLNSNNDVQKLN